MIATRLIQQLVCLLVCPQVPVPPAQAAQEQITQFMQAIVMAMQAIAAHAASAEAKASAAEAAAASALRPHHAAPERLLPPSASRLVSTFIIVRRVMAGLARCR